MADKSLADHVIGFLGKVEELAERVSAEFIESSPEPALASDDKPKTQSEPVEDVQALRDHYEEELASAQSDAQKVSLQHQDFVQQVRKALEVNPGPSDKEVLLQTKTALSTLAIIKKRLRTDDNLAAIQAVEDLLSHP